MEESYYQYYNVIRNRTEKQGYIVHWHPYVKLSYAEYVCIKKVGFSNVNKVVSMYEKGVPLQRIQEIFGLASCSCIYVILAYFGVKPRRKKHTKRGLLSEKEIKEIKNRYESGESIYSIAKKLGRPPSTIYYVLKRLGLK